MCGVDGFPWLWLLPIAAALVFAGIMLWQVLIYEPREWRKLHERRDGDSVVERYYRPELISRGTWTR